MYITKLPYDNDGLSVFIELCEVNNELHIELSLCDGMGLEREIVFLTLKEYETIFDNIGYSFLDMFYYMSDNGKEITVKGKGWGYMIVVKDPKSHQKYHVPLLFENRSAFEDAFYQMLEIDFLYNL